MTRSRKLSVPDNCQCPYCGRMPAEEMYRAGAESQRLRACLVRFWYSHNRACLVLLAVVLLGLNTLTWRALSVRGERLLSTSEAAAELGISEASVRRARDAFELPCRMRGGRFWFRTADVEEYREGIKDKG